MITCAQRAAYLTQYGYPRFRTFQSSLAFSSPKGTHSATRCTQVATSITHRCVLEI
jgi:hypothetical protein